MNDKLRVALARHGKPFKCGPVGLAREVMSHRTRGYLVKDWPEAPVEGAQVSAQVSALPRRARG